MYLSARQWPSKQLLHQSRQCLEHTSVCIRDTNKTLASFKVALKGHYKFSQTLSIIQKIPERSSLFALNVIQLVLYLTWLLEHVVKILYCHLHAVI